eukprot:gene15140-17910_t
MVALYKFDEPETETADVSPRDLLSWRSIDYAVDSAGNGFHLALGRLVSMTNVMTYSTGKPSTLPQKPRVGDKVVPESSDWCPSIDDDTPCGIGAVYRPTDGILDATDSFSYYARIPGTESLGDEGYISNDAFIDLFCEYVDEIQPADRELTLDEDTIGHAIIGVVATFGEQIPATITSLPDRGKLYEVQFKYGGNFWSNIETDTSVMQEIWYVPWTVGAAGTLDANAVRGAVLYKPVEHEHGVNYTDFKFKWHFDGLDTIYEATCYIHVKAVNDAPIRLPEDGETICNDFYYTGDEDDQYYVYPNGTCTLTSPAGSVIELKLNSTDSDRVNQNLYDVTVGLPSYWFYNGEPNVPDVYLLTEPMLGTLHQIKADGTAGDQYF